MRVKVRLSLLIFMIAISLLGCAAPPPRRARATRQAPSPCSTPVAPLRNHSFVVVINYNYSYNPKDPSGARAWLKSDIINRLNELGRPDGNSFAESNGQAVNFYINYTLNNDGQDHFTGSVELTGWGQGHITTQSLGQYPYASAAQLSSDLTDKAYSYVHGGWHDSRANCPQS